MQPLACASRWPHTAIWWSFKCLTFSNFCHLSFLKVLVTQWFPTLCDPVVCSPPGSSVHGILQARILHALLQGIFPTQWIKPWSPTLQADSLLFELPGKPISHFYSCSNEYAAMVLVFVFTVISQSFRYSRSTFWKIQSLPL